MADLDGMYLENLEEFVNDEDKIVTYKWLSLTLGVHVNQAKQMLYAFVQQQRNQKDNDCLSVTYLVAGLQTATTNGKVHQVQVVPEEYLEAVKSSFKPVTSCHIYSVQKCKLKDSNALYMADYDLLSKHIAQATQHSAIKCATAIQRTTDEMIKLVGKAQPTTAAENFNKMASHQNGTSKSHTTKKQGGIAGMFANTSKKTAIKDEKQNGSHTKDQEVEKSKTSTGAQNAKGKAKQGGVMAFFANQANKPKKEQKPSPEKDKSKPVDKSEHSKVSPEQKKSEVKDTKTRLSKGKKKANDSDDEGTSHQKKRRRIQQPAWESSSEEEEDESPIPPTPPREPSPLMKAVESDEEVMQTSPEKEEPRKEAKKDTPTKEVVVISGGKRRKRTRKLVPKTYMDDEGFMVTEKVWESESTDVSEAEEPTQPPAAQKQPTAKSSKPEEPKKKSPQKKSPQGKGTKQTSLMSFFKKK